MSDPKEIGAEAIEAWIEQQREKLHQQSQSGGAAPANDLNTLAERWLDLARSYLGGLAQYAERGTDARPNFQIGDDLIGVWRTAWTTGSMATDIAAERFSDLLRRLPPVGLAREQTEAWRELADAQVEVRRLEQEFKLVLTRVQSEALALLEEKVRERAQTAKPIASFRDLYDLWVDCGEQVYAKVAHSESYSRLQAELGNATMRFRARQQKVIEYALRQFDLPTRSELNSVHRQLRELRARLPAGEMTGDAEAPVPRNRGRKATSKPAPAKRRRAVTKRHTRGRGR